jgi:hypothetical protein
MFERNTAVRNFARIDVVSPLVEIPVQASFQRMSA